MISKSSLIELLSRILKINSVSDLQDKIKISKELLPTDCDFSSGNTDYDESYFYSINIVYSQIAEVLKSFDFNSDELTYYASW